VGLNTIFHNLSRNRSLLPAGSRVLSLDIGYGSVKKMLGDLTSCSGCSLVELRVSLPIEGPQQVTALSQIHLPAHEAELVRILPQIVDLVRSHLQQDPGIKVAVFDWVTSNSAVLLPVQELTRLCHER